MEYTVTNKEASIEVNGASYVIKAESRAPCYKFNILAVTKDDFDLVEVGSKISIGIHVWGKVAAPSELASIAPEHIPFDADTEMPAALGVK